MLVPYSHYEASSLLRDQLNNQIGGSLPYYEGRTVQNGSFKGAGIGSLFSKAFTFFKPVLKNAAKTVASSALNVATDMMNGQSFKNAAKSNFKSGGRKFLNSLSSSLHDTPSRGATKKQPIQRKRKMSKNKYKNKRRRTTSNIFD